MMHSENLSSADLKLKIDELEQQRDALNGCIVTITAFCLCLIISIVFLSISIANTPQMSQNSTILDPILKNDVKESMITSTT